MPSLRSMCFLISFLVVALQGGAAPPVERPVTQQPSDSREDPPDLRIWLVEQQHGGRLQWFYGYPAEIHEVRGHQIPKKLREDLGKFRQDRRSIGALARGREVAWIEWWDGDEPRREFQLFTSDPFYFVKATRNGEVRFFQVPRPWPHSDTDPDRHWRRDWQSDQQLMMAKSDHPGDWGAPRLLWHHVLDRRQVAALPMDQLGADYVSVFGEAIRRIPPGWEIEHGARDGEGGRPQDRVPQVYVSWRPLFLKSTHANGRVEYQQLHPDYTRGFSR